LATGHAETTQTLRAAFLNHNAFNMDTL
jgi:hypothetical protein